MLGCVSASKRKQAQAENWFGGHLQGSGGGFDVAAGIAAGQATDSLGRKGESSQHGKTGYEDGLGEHIDLWWQRGGGVWICRVACCFRQGTRGPGDAEASPVRRNLTR